MAKIHFVQIGQTKYPVAYTFSAMSEIEDAFGQSISTVLGNVGTLSAKNAQIIILAGLNAGERIQNPGKTKVYEAADLDEIFLGNGFHSYKRFVEILTKDSGIQRIADEATEEAKNEQARAQTTP